LFQDKLTDEVIRDAVRHLPPAIYSSNGKMLEERLISRRNSLLENAMKYYDFISGMVTVFGTDQNEIFKISGDQKITVSVFGAKKDEGESEKIYERIFEPDDTGFIYLDGYGGNDQFFIEPTASSKIKIRIRGGKGNDEYDLNGEIRSSVYDSVEEKNKIAAKKNAKVYLN
jgi:hypothetical protein